MSEPLLPNPAFNTLVINTVGEPGSGKTTLSFWLSQALKRAAILTEFVPEVVKYECFDPRGRQRVTSGRYDWRYLAQQMRLLRPLLGNVEVVINDGAFELSYFYAQRRMAPSTAQQFLERIEALRTQTQGGVETWFVMPRREHPYERAGRNESEAQAQQVRTDMVRCLTEEFGVSIRNVAGDTDREDLFQDIVRRVGELRGFSSTDGSAP